MLHQDHVSSFVSFLELLFDLLLLFLDELLSFFGCLFFSLSFLLHFLQMLVVDFFVVGLLDLDDFVFVLLCPLDEFLAV